MKSQIWVALSIYLLVVIAKKRLGTPCPLYTFLQILEVNLFEKKPTPSMVADALKQISDTPSDNKLNVFSLTLFSLGYAKMLANLLVYMIKIPLHNLGLKRDVAQPGSAPASGAGGRKFKSCHPDQYLQGATSPGSLFSFGLRSYSGPK